MKHSKDLNFKERIMNDFEIGQKVTIVETKVPAVVVDVNSFGVIVEDENGVQHVFAKGWNEIVPQSFLSESKK
jgi:hypothetical protein